MCQWTVTVEKREGNTRKMNSDLMSEEIKSYLHGISADTTSPQKNNIRRSRKKGKKRTECVDSSLSVKREFMWRSEERKEESRIVGVVVWSSFTL